MPAVSRNSAPETIARPAQRVDESLATPTFVIGGQMLKGAVGYDALKKAVTDARKRA